MCNRRRSSEIALVFLRNFHPQNGVVLSVLPIRVSALLKACESFKEKALFCYRISAQKK